jgi:hypothetical protein
MSACGSIHSSSAMKEKAWNFGGSYWMITTHAVLDMFKFMANIVSVYGIA